eukprot:gb/GECG01011840.1/.p1 GENE.gb/GECG01011840.1/~~gb/GECG01011840.1/.p1  ORF type:complete len:244 (+),score=32.41 gb/GECG01011840.1/:1-732(+)
MIQEEVHMEDRWVVIKFQDYIAGHPLPAPINSPHYSVLPEEQELDRSSFPPEQSVQRLKEIIDEYNRGFRNHKYSRDPSGVSTLVGWRTSIRKGLEKFTEKEKRVRWRDILKYMQETVPDVFASTARWTLEAKFSTCKGQRLRGPSGLKSSGDYTEHSSVSTDDPQEEVRFLSKFHGCAVQMAARETEEENAQIGADMQLLDYRDTLEEILMNSLEKTLSAASTSASYQEGCLNSEVFNVLSP